MSEPTGPALVERYLEHVRVEKRLAARTVELYALDLSKLRERAQSAGVELTRVQASHVRRWMAQMHGAGRSMRRRGGLTTSDVFRSMNGVRLEGNGLDRFVTMRGSFGHCTPSVWVDGLYLAQPQADEIDLIAPRERVTGNEVYNDATTPAEFQRALGGCGAIVIWTRAPRGSRSRSR